MAYASASDVFAYTRALIAPSGSYDASSCPTLTDVNLWLSSGCSIINARLGSVGYGAIPATSAAYNLALTANALYGAWQAERSRVNARVSADERTRADMFKKDFYDHLKDLVGLDLSRMGVTKERSGVYMSGISVSDKATVEDNTDRVTPRFKRDQHRNSERD